MYTHPSEDLEEITCSHIIPTTIFILGQRLFF